jgi:hypothetical protein
MWKGLKTMKECRRLRKSFPDRDGGVEWRAAMKSMGVKMMLV